MRVTGRSRFANQSGELGSAGDAKEVAVFRMIGVALGLAVVGSSSLLQPRIQSLRTIRTKAVSKLGLGVFLDIGFDAVPLVVLVPDALASRADGQKVAKGLHLAYRRLKLSDEFRAFGIRPDTISHVPKQEQVAAQLVGGVLERDRMGFNVKQSLGTQ